MASETLGAALRQINRLFTDGVVGGLSDAQLLDRFLAHGDATAFDVMVERHGPMVLSVCRGVLRDPHDAEDAFQATFLILLKKASSIRGQEVLAGWLYRVARRVAIQANADAGRRRTHERQARTMDVATLTIQPTDLDELLPALHEEIARLPEKYRVAVILCDLQRIPQTQAARQLHCSERTLRDRVRKGRELLNRRLTRRGLAPVGSTVGAMLLREATAAVPATWRAMTVREALAFIQPIVGPGVVSTTAEALGDQVIKSMMRQKSKLATGALLGTGMMAWGVSAVLISWRDETQLAGLVQAPAAQRSARPRAPKLPPDPSDGTGTVPISGRVLDPDGKPVAGAAIFIRHHNMIGGDSGSTGLRAQSGRVAATGADGRFQFQLDKASSNWFSYGQPAWHGATIAAAAPEFGPAWVMAGALATSGPATLRLVRDDVPIDGRIVDLEGRPVEGATVRLLEFAAPIQEDLNPWIKAALTLEADGNSRSRFFNTWLEVAATGLKVTRTTGPDGRFRLTGVGRERVVKIRIEGPTIETQDVYVLTRVHPTIMVPVMSTGMAGQKAGAFYTYYGARFGHVAKPTRPIMGVVRDQDSGRPVPGVRVESCRFADFAMFNHNIIQTVTDAEGKYRLAGMPKGSGNIISVTPPADQPYLPAVKEVDDRVGLEPVTADIALKRGIWIKGRVLEQESGQPAKALVHYYARGANPALAQVSGFKDAEAWLRFPTAEDGSFRVVGLPGPGLIGAIAMESDRYQPAERMGQLAARTLMDTYPGPIHLPSYHALVDVDPSPDKEQLERDLVVIPSNRLNGTVFDPDGKPLSGARVAGLDIVGSSWRPPGDSAAFTVTRLTPGQSRRLLFLHEGRTLAGSIKLEGNENKPLSVRLQPAGTVTGRLVDAEGNPRARITLEAFLAHESLPEAVRALPQSVLTDNEGRFQLAGLVPDLGYDAAIDGGREGLIGFAFKNVSVQGGQTRDLGDVKALAAAPRPR